MFERNGNFPKIIAKLIFGHISTVERGYMMTLEISIGQTPISEHVKLQGDQPIASIKKRSLIKNTF